MESDFPDAQSKNNILQHISELLYQKTEKSISLKLIYIFLKASTRLRLNKVVF